MSTRTTLVLAAIVFCVTLLVRWPARSLVLLLPAGISCDAPAGTVWRGSCGQLRSGKIALSGFNWVLHPLALLRLRLSADVASADPRAIGHASIELAPGGELQVRGLSAQLPLQGGLDLLPRGLAGTLQVAVGAAHLQRGQITALEGSVRVLQLRSVSESADLGSFELQFPAAVPDGTTLGQLRDLGGPLSVNGQLRLMRGGAYELSGWVAARALASSELVQALQLLGPADPQGRRMFSLTGML